MSHLIKYMKGFVVLAFVVVVILNRGVFVFSKIQLVVYHQCCVLIG